MNNKHLPIYLLFSVLLSCSKPAPIQEFWLTDPKGGVLFELIKEEQFSKDSLLTLVVDSETTYQSMDGFGFTLSQGSAKHLLAMSDSARYALLKELFGNGENTTESSLGVGGEGGNARGGGNVAPSEGFIAGIRVRTPRSNRVTGAIYKFCDLPNRKCSKTN